MNYSEDIKRTFRKSKEKVIHQLTDNYNEFIYEFGQKTNHFSFQLEKKIQSIETECIRSNRKNCGSGYTDFFYNEESKICCMFHPYKNGVCLHKIYVSPPYRKSHLGSELMEIIKEISQITGTKVYLIPIQTDDVPLEILRGFYHKFGYHRENMKSLYWSYDPNKDESTFPTLGFKYRMVG